MGPSGRANPVGAHCGGAHDAEIFFGFAEEQQPDSQGRVLISAKLRQLAGLQKEVVIVGVESHVEVWDAQAWERVEGSVEDEDVIAALSRSGF